MASAARACLGAAPQTEHSEGHAAVRAIQKSPRVGPAVSSPGTWGEQPAITPLWQMERVMLERKRPHVIFTNCRLISHPSQHKNPTSQRR